MINEQRNSKEVRTHLRRREGVKYKLRVVHQSGGLLELVEDKPPQHWFTEYARLMHYTEWPG